MNINFNTKRCHVCTFMNNMSAKVCSVCSTELPSDVGKIDMSVFAEAVKASFRQNLVDDNLRLADELIPEAWIPVEMLYIPCSINGRVIRAFIDTGAQMTVISKKCAEHCGIDNLIDYRVAGKAVGVGEKNILGKIWCVDIMVGHYALPSCFTVIDNPNLDFIFGLDMLKKHKCGIDFTNNCITIGECKISFIKKDDIMIDDHDVDMDPNGDLYD